MVSMSMGTSSSQLDAFKQHLLTLTSSWTLEACEVFVTLFVGERKCNKNPFANEGRLLSTNMQSSLWILLVGMGDCFRVPLLSMIFVHLTGLVVQLYSKYQYGTSFAMSGCRYLMSKWCHRLKLTSNPFGQRMYDFPSGTQPLDIRLPNRGSHAQVVTLNNERRTCRTSQK